MKKALIFGVIFSLFVFKVSAQTPDVPSDERSTNRNMKCLEVSPAHPDKYSPTDPKSDRVFVAEGVNFPANSTAYLLTCFSHPRGKAPFNNININCSTGNAEIDKRLGLIYPGNASGKTISEHWKDSVSTDGGSKTAHVFKVLNSDSASDINTSNEIKIGADGAFKAYFYSLVGYEFDIIDSKKTLESQGVNKQFYGFFFTEADLTNPSQGLPGKTEADSLQYASFKFAAARESCQKNFVFNDPKILAINPTNGEPVSDMQFTIRYFKEGEAPILVNGPSDPTPQLGVINPSKTNENGYISWFTSPGMYSIALDLPNLAVSKNSSDIPSNLKRLYDNPIDVALDPLQNGEVIDETTGFVEVQTFVKNPLQTLTEAKFVEGPTQVTINGLLIFTGKMNLPFVKVAVKGAENVVTASDKYGDFYMEIASDQLPPEAAAGIQFEITKQDLVNTPYEELVTPVQYGGGSIGFQTHQKIDSIFSSYLSKLESLFIKNVSAQSLGTTVDIEPILPYLEGFAKDVKGDSISFATVKVKVKDSDAVYTTISADENGFFILYPKDLPMNPYYIEFLAPNSSRSFKQSTSEFYKSNEAYLKSNEINLIAGKKANVAVPVSRDAAKILRERPELIIKDSDNVLSISPTPTNANSKPILKNNTLAMVILMIFVLVLIIGAPLLYIYFKKLEQEKI